ncbi:hypothetical protein ScalyP_jg10405 [Parmales sp. scaly parma]|nr:hypothetical protein ScalyP_jg10405 [Parmales sp. scaly parma]
MKFRVLIWFALLVLTILFTIDLIYETSPRLALGLDNLHNAIFTSKSSEIKAIQKLNEVCPPLSTTTSSAPLTFSTPPSSSSSSALPQTTFSNPNFNTRRNFYLNQWSSPTCATPLCAQALASHKPGKTTKFPTVTSYDEKMHVEKIYCVGWEAVAEEPLSGKFNLLIKLGVGDNLFLYWSEYLEKLRKAGKQNSPSPIAVKFGDDKRDVNLPLLRKTRYANSNSVILFKMGGWRHWVGLPDLVIGDTVAWADKADKAVWRGSTTGAGGPKSYPKLIDGNKIGQDTGSFSQRAQLVRRIPYFDEHFSEILDVGVTEYVQGVPALWGTKGELSRGEQIRHKMIIIAEGNDVATATKWALISSSAIIMAAPTVSSWLMEELLVAYIHYIPVEPDFSDLAVQVQWCLDNLDDCKRIGNIGRCFMAQFLDSAEEDRMTLEILQVAEQLNSMFDMCE